MLDTVTAPEPDNISEISTSKVTGYHFELIPVAELASDRICAARTVIVNSSDESNKNEEETCNTFSRVADDKSYRQILRHMFEDLCSYISERLNKGFNVVSIVIDLSFLMYPDDALLEELVIIVDSAGIPHNYIIFEFNENFFLSDCNQVRKIILRLRSLGFRTAAVGVTFMSGGHECDYNLFKQAGNSEVDAHILETAQLNHIRLCAGRADSRYISKKLYNEGFMFASGEHYGGRMLIKEFYDFYDRRCKQAHTVYNYTNEKKKQISHQIIQQMLLFVPSTIILLITIAIIVSLVHFTDRALTLKDLFTLIIVLLIPTLSTFTVIFISSILLKHRLANSKKRYLLLEEFSDTVLFDYDCRSDFMCYTNNASSLFFCGRCEQYKFLQKLENSSVYSADCQSVRSVLSCSEASEGEWRLRLLAPDRSRYIWCLVHYKYLRTGHNYTSVIGIITDIDEQQQREAKLIELSERDCLTGLLNKSSSENRIRELMKSCNSGAFYMIDIDNFRGINNNCGHNSGDLALIYVADCIRCVFRADDILGRFGGDEMTAFVAGTTDKVLLRQRAELLISKLSVYNGDTVDGLSCSIGIALFPGDGDNWNDLFCAADNAMYDAKKRGKQCISFYSELSPE